MAITKIACPSCGSSDCQDVKNDRFLCNSCDTVFLYNEYSSTTRVLHDGSVKLEAEREYCPICDELSGDNVFKCPECKRTGLHCDHRISLPHLHEGSKKETKKIAYGSSYRVSIEYKGGLCEECARKRGFACEYCGRLHSENQKCQRCGKFVICPPCAKKHYFDGRQWHSLCKECYTDVKLQSEKRQNKKKIQNAELRKQYSWSILVATLAFLSFSVIVAITTSIINTRLLNLVIIGGGLATLFGTFWISSMKNPSINAEHEGWVEIMMIPSMTLIIIIGTLVSVFVLRSLAGLIGGLIVSGLLALCGGSLWINFPFLTASARNRNIVNTAIALILSTTFGSVIAWMLGGAGRDTIGILTTTNGAVTGLVSGLFVTRILC